MAETAKGTGSARRSASTGSRSAMKYWVLQQGTEYYVVASENQPDLRVPDGERRKVIRGYQNTDELAWKSAENFATINHGTVRQ